MKMHRALYLAAAALALATAPARGEVSVAAVSISGSVTGDPETVVFSGEARIHNKLVRDPDFNSPRYILTIDMSGVSGVGSQTLKKYAIAGPAIQQKTVAAAHVVDITFPFQESGSVALDARSGAASFAISFDAATGAITAATGSVASPRF